jgi:hypothetical protein
VVVQTFFIFSGIGFRGLIAPSLGSKQLEEKIVQSSQ